MLSYAEACEALRGERLPAVLIDLDALERNRDRVLASLGAHSLPLRIATKSVRVVAVLRHLLETAGGRFQGLMCYSVEEAAFLASQGFDDLLVAYPPWQSSELALAARLVAEGKRLAVVADSREAADRISQHGASAGARVPVVLCVDMSLRLLAGRIHVGVRRSPLHSPEEVVRVARHVAALPGCAFHGLMGYEAQVAGLGDDNPFDPSMNTVKAVVRRASALELGRRRSAMVRALGEAGLPPAVVNGGGSGSLDSTLPTTGVTEVTAGSAFFKPHLFDYYRTQYLRELEPACFFALEVTRRPTRGIVTCLGGGYVASGPPGPDKAPLPFLPAGLSLLPHEMAGEVQTPLAHPPEVALALGDPVLFRHAKAGEIMERFREALLVRRGAVVERVPTYRGQGQCFL